MDSLSVAILKDLAKAGLTARRLSTGDPLPTAGWLVRGVFTNVERAVVGFGRGRRMCKCMVDIHDLGQGAPTQFHAVTNTASASSGKLPGAAPMIERHPATVAARFLMAGNDLNKNVKQTAAQIAEAVVKRLVADNNQPNAGKA